MLMSPTIGKLAEALAKAQAVFLPVQKNRTVTVSGTTAKGKDYTYDFDYADLDAIIAATRAGLTANGIALTQMLGETNPNTGALTTLLSHSSGEFLSETITFTKMKAAGELPLTMQELGSQVTYLRRYQRAAILDIAAETDDDGGVTEDMHAKTAKAREPKHEEEFDFAIKKRETTGEYAKPAEYWDRWEAAIKNGDAMSFMKPTKTKPNGIPAWRMKSAEQKKDPAKERTPGVGPGAPPPDDTTNEEADWMLAFQECTDLATLTGHFNKLPADKRRPGTKLFDAFKKRRTELGAKE